MIRLRLRPPRLDDEAVCLAAHEALAVEDFFENPRSGPRKRRYWID